MNISEEAREAANTLNHWLVDKEITLGRIDRIIQLAINQSNEKEVASKIAIIEKRENDIAKLSQQLEGKDQEILELQLATEKLTKENQTLTARIEELERHILKLEKAGRVWRKVNATS